ncbi:adhesion G protein-coupled receptor L2-like isoform X1 [Dreissena polymorpha]|uniref:Uncharacterized protein n=1 Tax=Dreissena polymorpha TaxID=45954 RepID=A0A9D4HQA6_DREPO|nr:adhesion G protein-coupled receptor L2-like isoform X1 [Dreissena polymorpha]KAH3727045.1 hypothetical protein DPMN_052970 [Dreissena polymorpha]
MFYLGYILFGLCVTRADSTDPDQAKYSPNELKKNSLACENRSVNLQCKEGLIRVLFANYGRANLYVCGLNDIAMGWSVNCSANDSIRIVSERCDHKRSCDVIASNSIFGDPCPSTNKYLDIAYFCYHDLSARCAKPQGDLVNIEKQFYDDGETISITNRNCEAGYHPSFGDLTLACTSGQWSKEISCVPDTTLLQCESDIDFNNETWRIVAAGFVETHNCSNGYKGIVTRKCNAKGIYEQPVYNCTQEAIHDLLKMIKITAVAETIEGLRTAMRASPDNDNTTAEHQNIHVGDIEAATQIIQFIVNNIEINTSTIENVTDSFVDVVDNLISERATQSWGALIDKGGAAAVINVLDDLISKVTNNISVTQQNLTVAKENILIEIGTVDECSMIKFPDTEKNGNLPSWTSNRHTSIEVNCSETGGVTFSGSLFRNLSSIMSTRNENATHVEINAPVLAFTIHKSRKESSERLDMTLVFQLFKTGLEKPSCSLWKKDNSSDQGFWSSEGCKLVEYNHQAGRVTCSCNHLTNFAVLMSPATTIDMIHHQALSAITVVGCSMSLGGLFTTAVIYVCFWRMVKSNRAILLLNLCGALFVAYLAFLIGIKRTQPMGACTFTAVLLHYVYLVAFFLMLAEGGDLALMVMRPLAKWNIIPYFLAGAYGIPAIIVGISMGATQLDGYGNERFCWLTVESGLFWAFAGPVLAIVMANLIVLVLVLKKLFGVSAMSKKTDAEKIKTGVRSVCILLPVLGLTWVFGIFAVNKDTLIFQYLFAICNSVQGFLIFLVQCVFDKKVSDALRRIKIPWFSTSDVRTGDTHVNST